MELQVPSPRFLPLGQDAVENAEQLQDALFATGASSSRKLNGEWMHTTIVAANLETAMTYADATNKLHIRKEALDAYEV
jgi:hypothetical protein